MLTPEYLEGRRRHLKAKLDRIHERLTGELPERHRQWKQSVLIPEMYAALARIDHGTYGICEDCDTEISLARLNRRPEARCCVSCQNAKEGHHAAP